MATAILYNVTPSQEVPFLATIAVKVGGGLEVLVDEGDSNTWTCSDMGVGELIDPPSGWSAEQIGVDGIGQSPIHVGRLPQRRVFAM
jgi:hypothetical protein